jgi:hypothetical protein
MAGLSQSLELKSGFLRPMSITVLLMLPVLKEGLRLQRWRIHFPAICLWRAQID